MKRNSGTAIIGDTSPHRLTLALAIFVLVVALTGGGSRSDIASLPLLRGFATLAVFVMLALTPSAAWRGIRVPLALLGLLALWMGVQLVPLPPSFWSTLPLRDQIFAIDQLLGDADRWRSISLSPAATLNSLLSLIVPLGALLVAAALPAGERIRLWWAVWIFGLASVVFGLLQFMAGPRSLFYLYRITNEGSLVGLFANRNHYALLLSLSILAAGWLIANEMARKNRHMLLIPALMGSIIIFLLFILAIGSRLGLICGVGSVLLVYAVVRWSYRFEPKPINQIRTKRQQRSAPPARSVQLRRVLLNILPFAVLLGLAAIFYFSGRSNTVDRLVMGDSAAEIRVAAFGAIFALLKGQWLLGSGFGSFAGVYQIVEPDALLREDYLNQAHNDWLQLPIEGGLPAVLIFLVGVVWIGSMLIGAWRSRRKPAVETIELVILAAAFGSLAIGCLVDYPLRTPSIAMVAAFFAVILIRHRTEVSNRNSAPKAASVS